MIIGGSWNAVFARQTDQMRTTFPESVFGRSSWLARRMLLAFLGADGQAVLVYAPAGEGTTPESVLREFEPALGFMK